MSEEKSGAPAKAQTMREWLDGYRGKFEEAIPRGTIDVSRFITAASLEIANNPKLANCNKLSLFQSLLDSARYGLEVGRLMGQAWLIPYNESRPQPDGSWRKEMTCHFQIGYKGTIVLARRSNTIKSIIAETVYENDSFEVELGMGRHLTHKVNILKERGEPIAYYCLVELVNGGYQFAVLTKSDAQKHRDKYSKVAGAKETSVWDTNFDEMAIKTVVLKVLKLCPISVEALEAANRAEQQDAPMRRVGASVDLLPPPPDHAEPDPDEIDIAEVPAPQQPSKIAQRAVEAARKAAGSEKPAEETKPASATVVGKQVVTSTPLASNAQAAYAMTESLIREVVPEPDKTTMLKDLALCVGALDPLAEIDRHYKHIVGRYTVGDLF